MTMLNGEPVDTGVPSKAPAAVSTAPKTAGAQPGSPPVGFRGAPTISAQGVDPSNLGMAQILAVVGLIMAFAVPPMGIIMGGIAGAMLKPRKSGLARWAIILGIVFTIAWILATVAFFVLLWVTTTSALCVEGEVVNEVLGIPICN
jgi:hypothetical protein